MTLEEILCKCPKKVQGVEIGVLAKHRMLKERRVKEMEKLRWPLPVEHLNVEINPAYGREFRRCQILNTSREYLYTWRICGDTVGEHK